MMRDIPFPMPLSVIFSPSHITNTVPAVSITTEENLKKNPESTKAVSGNWAARFTRYVGA
jgi:hypothetical protein